MIISRVDDSISEITGQSINTYSQLQWFKVLKEEKKNIYFLNLFKTYINKIPDFITNDMLESYIVLEEDWWENIAYKWYGNVKLWWILPCINNVINPFEFLEEGKSIKILKTEYLSSVVMRMVEGLIINGS